MSKKTKNYVGRKPGRVLKSGSDKLAGDNSRLAVKGTKPESGGVAGQTAREKLKAVNPSGGTDASFFELVYEVARQIPRGRVTSYGAIAACLGTRLSARMVGWAMNGAHHAHLKVPAHRVVNRNGMLTGKHHFADAGEMQRLLEKEKIIVLDDQVQDFKNVFWDPSTEIFKDL